MIIDKRVRLLGAASLVIVLASGWALGWTRGKVPWQEATGWNELDSELRPPRVLPIETASDEDRDLTLEWLGHAGFALRLANTTVLVDPNLNSWCGISRRQLECPGDLTRLGRVDAVLVSHAHLDHLDFETLHSIAADLGRIVVPTGAERYFEGREWAVGLVEPLAHDTVLPVGELEVIAVEAAHNGSRSHPFKSDIDASGYIVRAGGRAIYFAGDTGRGNDFYSIKERYRPKVAVLPIGAFAPRFPLARYHLNPEEAVDVGLLLGVDRVVPSHFGTFRLSLDRPEIALPRFAREAHLRGLAWQMPELFDALPDRLRREPDLTFAALDHEVAP